MSLLSVATTKNFMSRLIDITGQTFGRLTVVGLSHIERPNKGTSRAFWHCICRCGNKVVMRGDGMKMGHSKSCGCQKIESALKNRRDLTRRRFGRLFVLEVSYKDRNNALHWKCVCDCGNTVSTPTSLALLSGRAKSCGCLQREMMMSRSGENSSHWRGGTQSREQYGDEWDDNLKEFIRNRDNRKCQYLSCEYTDVGARKRLHVHHINRDKKNCNPYNLISLCNSHHTTVEDNPSWMSYFYSITEEYEHENSYSG